MRQAAQVADSTNIFGWMGGEDLKQLLNGLHPVPLYPHFVKFLLDHCGVEVPQGFAAVLLQFTGQDGNGGQVLVPVQIILAFLELDAEQLFPGIQPGLHQTVQQSGLSRTKKAGDDIDRQDGQRIVTGDLIGRKQKWFVHGVRLLSAEGR